MLETLPKNIELQNHILPKPRIKSDAGMKRYKQDLGETFFLLINKSFSRCRHIWSEFTNNDEH